MTRGAFDPDFADLPRIIPVFPLTGVLLLPGGRLPLNIFEPRYLAMTRGALAEEHRIIGMVQPRTPDPGDNRGRSALAGDGPPQIYTTGCAGRITSFNETGDGRYVLALSGLCRFTVVEEMALKDGYRRVLADYHRFRGDLAGDAPGADIDRTRLLQVVRRFFEDQGIDANWEAIESMPDATLVTQLAMSIPFGPNERQALLEAPDATERSGLIITLMEMALIETGSSSETSH